MVATTSGYCRQGVRDWLIQRVSAVVLGLYLLYLTYFYLSCPVFDYAAWAGLFQQTWMKVFSLLALLALMLHAWIGIWTVLTDYIKPWALRLGLEIIVVLALLGYFVWGVQIMWSV